VAFAGPCAIRFVYRAHSFQGLEPLLPGLGLVLCLSCLDWLWISILVGSDKIWLITLNFAPVLVAKLVLGPLWIPADGSIGMVRAAVVGQVVTGALGASTAVWAYLRKRPDPA
jgi:O-antigen/teichoic acid export membrane protein